MCAKAFGADAVAITDIKPDNLDLAARLGADATVLLEPSGNPGEVRAAALTRLSVAGLRLCSWALGVAPGAPRRLWRRRGSVAGPSPSRMGSCASL